MIEIQEVHIARIAGIPDGGDADLGAGAVLLCHASGVEHCLGGALGFGLCDGGRDLVELAVCILEAGGRGERASAPSA